VFNVGSNKLAKNSEEDRSALVTLLQLAQNYVNTNVLMVNIPTRYDLSTTSQQNHEIKKLTDSLLKRTQLLNNVHLI
jgi:plasmid maintenance system antidote protein VapI